MRAVDTNVLVRLIVRDDPRQVAAGAWVSLLALLQTVWVLTATRRSAHLIVASACSTAHSDSERAGRIVPALTRAARSGALEPGPKRDGASAPTPPASSPGAAMIRPYSLTFPPRRRLAPRLLLGRP